MGCKYSFLFALALFAVEATRVSQKNSRGMATVQETEDEGSAHQAAIFEAARATCSDIVKHGQDSVDCDLGPKLGGGRQANTNIVKIEGQTYVMKETHSEDTLDGIRTERAVATRLAQVGFQQMPAYFLDFDAVKAGSEVLVMEALAGWHDLSAKTIQGGFLTKAVPRAAVMYSLEVRAAAFFLALDQFHKAGISHCDLNEGNVMFKADNPTAVKLIDFGLSQFTGRPGFCSGMGLPDKGSSGAAWNNIYATMITGRPGSDSGMKLSRRQPSVTNARGQQMSTISSTCMGTPCNTENARNWQAMLAQSKVLVSDCKSGGCGM